MALVQEMDFDFKGEIVGQKVYEGIIKSQKRLTYGEAEEIMEHAENLKSFVNDDVFESLKQSKALAQILIKKHYRNHALNLDIPETLIVLDNQGEVQEILKEKRLFAHMMIEQFMLEANKAVSRFLEKKERVFMYRIHDRPESEKLRSLEKFSQMFGFPNKLKKRSDLIRFLSETDKSERKDLINKILLRSLAQACYSTENKGHYGLNFTSYTHFTSPIRRYCDLHIHREVKEALSKQPKKPCSKKELEKKARLISEKERNSIKAERMLKDIKKARFLKKHLGEKFKGYVSSLSSFGIFVSLESFDVEGLIRFENLRGFWEVDEFSLIASEKRSGRKIHFGQEMEILVTSCDTETGRIDFDIVGEEKREKKPKRNEKGRRVKKEGKSQRGSRGKKEAKSKKNRKRGKNKDKSKKPRRKKKPKPKRR